MPKTRISRGASVMLCGVLGIWVIQAYLKDTRGYRVMREIEQARGVRLRHPAYLPKGWHLDSMSPTAGVIRDAIWRYENATGDVFFGVALEKRDPLRDKYNRKVFSGKPVSKQPYITSGYLVNTSQHFAYREFDDVVVIVTSHTLRPNELVRVARSME